MKTELLKAVALSLSLLSAACASTRQIEATSAEAVIEAVNKGDEVTIVTRNGKRYQFVVTKLTNKALYGDGYRVNYEDMATVELRNTDGMFKRIGNIF